MKCEIILFSAPVTDVVLVSYVRVRNEYNKV